MKRKFFFVTSKLIFYALVFTSPVVVWAVNGDSGELLEVLEAERPSAGSLSRLDVLEVAVVKGGDEDTEAFF
ncbi:MAG: hypothetical protein D3924_16710 [Candidatus Electrothrix sp. AR4]|nr:hypothetical protein [Candidatus Electrothrix sp. AR4]